MRRYLLSPAGSAGLALILLAIFPAGAMPIAAPAAALRAAAALDLTEAVHCRKYVHRHRRGHARGRGCDEDADAARRPATRGSGGVYAPAPLKLAPLPQAGRPPGNYFNPSNPQDRSGGSNPQDMTQPRAFNPQDMR
jgi:hypothetical protein